VTINQDAAVYATVLAPEQRVTHALARPRRGWLQVARGTLTLNGQALAHGDGAAIEGAHALEIQGIESAEALFFDLP